LRLLTSSPAKHFLFLANVACACLLLAHCSSVSNQGSQLPGVRLALLPPNVHGRLIARTMRPQYITIHSTQEINATAAQHAHYLLAQGKRSKNNPRFGRSGWVTWHFTVDDREAVEHLLPTEQGDHADYGGPGDRLSIGIEICEFRNRARQEAAINRAARLTAALSRRFNIPIQNIVPHMHWPRWDYQFGKPCPRILLERDHHAPGGWRLGTRWNSFIALVKRYR
jgi:N-acetylmuramoyl-L-alanine amidase